MGLGERLTALDIWMLSLGGHARETDAAKNKRCSDRQGHPFISSCDRRSIASRKLLLPGTSWRSPSPSGALRGPRAYAAPSRFLAWGLSIRPSHAFLP